MIFVLNYLLGLGFAYTVYYHIFFIMGVWLILYLLFQSHMIDVFLITSASLVLIALSSVCLFIAQPLITLIFGEFNYYGFDNYWAGLALNRILIFTTLYIIRDKISYFYTLYRNNWNRTDGAKIKSITVRNISCVALNIMIYLLYVSIVCIALE